MRGIIGTKNIQHTERGYIVRKYRNGEHLYLGCGKTLIIALMKRDWCMANDWKPYPRPNKYIYKMSNGSYQIVKKGVRNGEYYIDCLGTYRTLSDAQSERDKLVSVGWDLDAWCDLG